MAGRKKEFSEEQRDLIQKMIYENDSFSTIGERVGAAPQTVERFVKREGLDMSKYDFHVCKKRMKTITLQEKKQIEIDLQNRVGKGAIAKKIGVTPATLAEIMKREGIDESLYKHPTVSHMRFLTEDEVEKLKSMAKSNAMFSDIAKELHVSRNLVSVLLDRYGIEVKNRKPVKSLTSIQIKALREIAKMNISPAKMALCFNVSQKTLKTTMRANDIDPAYLHTKEPMKSEDIIRAIIICNKTLLHLNNMSSLSKEQLEILPDLIKKIPFGKICRRMRKSERFMREVFRISNLYRHVTYEGILNSEYVDEFKKDMLDPRQRNSAMARKYGTSATTICNWRKKYFGTKLERENNFYNKTSAEANLEEILNALDLVYEYQYEILDYHVDYYIGQGIVIEVQGDYWHKVPRQEKPDPKKSDAKKKSEIEAEGYTVLQIWEHDINEKPDSVAKQIFNAYIEAIKKHCM